MWRRGTMTTCVGARGVMSLNATTWSSWNTMAAGICPATILQKRQSATLPPEDRDPRDSLQVATHPRHIPAPILRHLAHGCFLAEPEFHNEPAARGKMLACAADKPPDHIEPIVPAVEGGGRLVARHFRLKRWGIAGRDVWRV